MNNLLSVFIQYYQVLFVSFECASIVRKYYQADQAFLCPERDFYACVESIAEPISQMFYESQTHPMFRRRALRRADNRDFSAFRDMVESQKIRVPHTALFTHRRPVVGVDHPRKKRKRRRPGTSDIVKTREKAVELTNELSESRRFTQIAGGSGGFGSEIDEGSLGDSALLSGPT
jgi:hypothetical protein